MGHEVIFDDHAVRKQDILDYKNNYRFYIFAIIIGLKRG